MRTLIFALALVAPLAIAAPARADVPPPDAEACHMKNDGDACKADDGSDHTCLQQKCSKTMPDGNGGTTTTEYDCVLCNGPAVPSDTGGGDAEDSGCAFRNRAAAGAAGAWALGAAVLLLGRRLKKASRGRRRP
ncbi:hypothetical protein [Polyangium aurulentum]|uniref:hypothetical protein n=1 Tax=Polyangium aurulentum TaxID=2567896 RepID=UPI0010AE22F2|nr:hypothetical protein [Polyangium aurulentum]UQA59190.1 hypothetical protein E8A73_001335 [Polyangium aurulentum]